MNHFYQTCKRIFLLFALAIFSKFSIAQNIKGTVVDSHTGEPLVGATIKLEGTKFNTIAKLDGSFNFSKLTPGTYNVTVTFAGYSNASSKANVLAEANGNKTMRFLLVPLSKELTSISISASSGKESDAGARWLEKIANPILNVLSARTLQLLPDITVANALQRVSGVTIERSGSGEARYPIIRGMEKRYINTLVNGIKIPSPDNKNRFVPLDLFPSELLERLEVSKSLTPSMEGDAIGGTINLQMKDAPASKLLQANLALGYSNIFANQPFQKFNKSSINKQSPAEINGSTYAAVASDFGVSQLNFTDNGSPINTTMGLTIGNRFGKDKKFGFILSGSYQNIFRGTTSNFFLPNSQPGLNNIPLFSDLQLRKYSVNSKRLGLTGKVDFKINNNNKISLTNTYVHLDDFQSRVIYDTVALNSLVTASQRSTWQYQSIYNATLQGIHKLTPSFNVDWDLVYSIANNHVPDQAQFSHQYAIVSTTLTKDLIQSMTRLWTHNSDKDYAAYLNLTKNTNIFSRPIELKIGGLVRDKTRDNFYNSYSLSPTSGEVFTNISSAVFQLPTGGGVKTPSGNDYTFKETISSGYLQGKWQLSNKLEALGGLRVENTHQQYETALSDAVAAKSGTIHYTDWLPSAQFKYEFKQKQVLRLAYYKAIARPAFAELIPDGIEGEFFKEQGTPITIEHSYADNVDLRYELYGKGSNQILLGAFYKYIVDPIEISAVKPQGINNLYLEPVNLGNATNYGFEAVVTKYFGSFGVTANYTYTKSSLTNDSMLTSSRNSTGQIVSSRVSETRPLQGQSNHVGNLSLIYKDPKVGLDVQVAIVYTGERISFLSPYLGLHYWQAPTTQLDMSFEKRIVKKFTIYGKVNNITNAAFELSLHQSYNNYLAASGSRALALQSDPDNKIIIQKDFYKTSYLVGLRYKF